MKILGISALFHDAAAALIVDGTIVAAAQEERFSRIKQDAAIPVQAARYCLEEAGLTTSELDHVVFYEKPLRKFERILSSQLASFPFGAGQFSRAMRSWLGKRLWIRGELSRTLGCHPDQLLFGEHHLSHAAAAFLPSPYPDAAILCVDGVGESACTSIFHGTTGKEGPAIKLIEEHHYPHSLGLFYSAITAYLGFRVNEGEYKVMGLASYGEPVFLSEFESLFSLDEEGALRLDLSYFRFHRSTRQSYSKKLESLLGPARRPDSALRPGDGDFQRFANIAATMQACTERILLVLARRASNLTGSSQLCLAGGVALNSVATLCLAEAGLFDKVYVQPAAGDAGGALGAALYVACIVGSESRPSLDTVALGQAFAQRSVETFLDDCGLQYQRFDSEESLAEEVARRLARGNVAGWFTGRFEWGPRALCQRSILADPRTTRMRDRVNASVKFRESFRPFAPVLLEEELERYFHIPDAARPMLPFMSTVLRAKDTASRDLAGVVHIDGTSRVQCVSKGQNALLETLLRAFKKKTGVGALLNTSMNLKDEPICASPAEAYATFARSDMDFLVLNRCLIEERPQWLKNAHDLAA